MKLSKDQVFNNPEKYIKFMVFNLYITIDNQAFNLSMKLMSERLIGGSYCYYCNGRYRTTTWVERNRVNVLGFVTT